MKNKVCSLAVMLMFIVGMIPAAFAAESVSYKESKILLNSGVAVSSADIANTPEFDVVELRPVEVKSVGEVRSDGINEINDAESVSGAVEADGSSVSPVSHPVSGVMKLKPIKLAKISDKKRVEKKTHNKKAINWFRKRVKFFLSDEFLSDENYNGEKAAKFLIFSTLLTERAIDLMDHAEKKIENSPEFLANHPDALEKVAEERAILEKYYHWLFSIVADECSPEECRPTLASIGVEDYAENLPTLRGWAKEIKKISKNKYLRSYAKHHRVKVINKMKKALKNWRNKYGNDKVDEIESRIVDWENADTSEEKEVALKEIKVSMKKLKPVDNPNVIKLDRSRITVKKVEPKEMVAVNTETTETNFA